MPRIPYVTDAEAGDTPLVAAIRQRRGGGLLNIDRQLLHSAPFAEGWGAFLGAVRGRLSIDAKLRELAMLVVVVLNDAEYEVVQHGPLFVKAGGSDAQLAAIKAMKSKPIDPALFGEIENAVIHLAFQSTTMVKVDDDTFATLARHVGRQQVLELVGTVAAYNMVSRLIVALDIEIE
jgi:alkylhydroperoxidase family enzyme